MEKIPESVMMFFVSECPFQIVSNTKTKLFSHPSSLQKVVMLKALFNKLSGLLSALDKKIANCASGGKENEELCQLQCGQEEKRKVRQGATYTKVRYFGGNSLL